MCLYIFFIYKLNYFRNCPSNSSKIGKDGKEMKLKDQFYCFTEALLVYVVRWMQSEIALELENVRESNDCNEKKCSACYQMNSDGHDCKGTNKERETLESLRLLVSPLMNDISAHDDLAALWTISQYVCCDYAKQISSKTTEKGKNKNKFDLRTDVGGHIHGSSSKNNAGINCLQISIVDSICPHNTGDPLYNSRANVLDHHIDLHTHEEEHDFTKQLNNEESLHGNGYNTVADNIDTEFNRDIYGIEEEGSGDNTWCYIVPDDSLLTANTVLLICEIVSDNSHKDDIQRDNYKQRFLERINFAKQFLCVTERLNLDKLISPPSIGTQGTPHSTTEYDSKSNPINKQSTTSRTGGSFCKPSSPRPLLSNVINSITITKNTSADQKICPVSTLNILSTTSSMDNKSTTANEITKSTYSPAEPSVGNRKSPPTTIIFPDILSSIHNNDNKNTNTSININKNRHTNTNSSIHNAKIITHTSDAKTQIFDKNKFKNDNMNKTIIENTKCTDKGLYRYPYIWINRFTNNGRCTLSNLITQCLVLEAIRQVYIVYMI